MTTTPRSSFLVIIERDDAGGFGAWAHDLPGVVAAAETYGSIVQQVE
ncbi:type II toxin-antitoxin system HicB family antitoxin [Allokutzneria sp. NRRL B-24872]|nr:hypothetical protein [Allokutzneria sp. NRRL B-24872]